ncbi:CBS domain-containing protein, partial [Nanoarchaeota archaeon]
DINNRVVAEGKDPKELKAQDIMSKPIEVFQKDEDITKVYKNMRDNKRIMCAVVDENKKFIGMITIGEALNCLAQH